MGHPKKLELTREGLLVKLANYYTPEKFNIQVSVVPHSFLAKVNLVNWVFRVYKLQLLHVSYKLTFQEKLVSLYKLSYFIFLGVNLLFLLSSSTGYCFIYDY